MSVITWSNMSPRQRFGSYQPYRRHFHGLEKDSLLQEHIDSKRKRSARGSCSIIRPMEEESASSSETWQLPAIFQHLHELEKD